MSPISKSLIVGAILLFGIVLITGCGSSNSQAPFDADTQQHPADWKWTHKTAAQQDPTACTECHGDDLSGGISKVPCFSCHLNGSPYVLTDCTSCHGNPPVGTVAPNRAGAHNTATGHFAAQVILPDGCNTCHGGAGSGTLNHDNGTVVISLLNSYSANSGTIVYNADGTCSNASCHGGQTTPNWLTGTINLSTQCASCHSFGTSEYNSFVSGEHGLHIISLGIACTACHDTNKLAVNHFTTLNTKVMEGPASATLNNSLNYVPATFTCTPSCHGTDVWDN
jgi:predicted CxxxxCH...CXXCH cytochrome family protein